MVQVADRVELKDLFKPQIVLAAAAVGHIAVIDQVLLAADLLDLFLEAGYFNGLVLDAWEYIVQERLQQWQVFADQTWYEGLHDRLDEDLLLIQFGCDDTFIDWFVGGSQSVASILDPVFVVDILLKFISFINSYLDSTIKSLHHPEDLKIT